MHHMDERFLAAVARFEPNGHRKLGHFTSLSDFPEDRKQLLARAEQCDRKIRARSNFRKLSVQPMRILVNFLRGLCADVLRTHG